MEWIYFSFSMLMAFFLRVHKIDMTVRCRIVDCCLIVVILSLAFLSVSRIALGIQSGSKVSDNSFRSLRVDCTF